MSEHSAVAVFDTVSQAKAATQMLDQQGVPRDRVTIVARELESKQEVHGYISGSDQDATVGFKGAIAGGLIGLALGAALMGLSWGTPLGEQFGLPLAIGGTMACILAGIVFGALIGGMTGRSVKEARIEPYDEMVKAGKSLVIAHGSHEEMSRAQAIMKQAGATESKVHHHVTAPADTTQAV